MVIQLMISNGGGNLALLMLCNKTPPVGLLFFTIKICIVYIVKIYQKKEKFFYALFPFSIFHNFRWFTGYNTP